MDDTKIKIVGIGEGGARALVKIVEAGVGRNKNINFIAIGNDENILLSSVARENIFLNRDTTTVYKRISSALRGAKIVIIVAGIGGSAATRALPLVISCTKNFNAATVAFVNKPFVLENEERKKNAEYCLSSLRDVNTKFIFSSEKFFLFRLYQKEISITELFEVANEIFCQGVKIFLEMNSDKNSLCKLGNATFGYGFGVTAFEAIKNAANFPTFEPDEIKNARKIFVRLTSDRDASAKDFIKKMINPKAKLFWQVNNLPGEKILASIIFPRKEA